MWPRVLELIVGVWLCASPQVVSGAAGVERFVSLDAAVGVSVVVLSLLSFATRTRWAHLGTAGLAVALGAYAYFSWPRPGPPSAQNEIIVSMLLLLLAIIPNECTRPPRPWRSQR